MAKKAKVKKEGGGFKAMLDQSWEKILFGLALFGGTALLAMGLSARAGIDSAKTPEKLSQEISQAQQHVTSFDWKQDYEAERDVDKNLRERADQTMKPLVVEGYSFPQMLKPPYHPPRVRRSDPVLFAAERLEARAGFGFASEQSTSEEAAMFNQGIGMPTPDGTGADGKKPDGRPIPDLMMMNAPVAPGRDSGYARPGMGSTGTNYSGRYFVSVTGLVPYRQQIVEYLDRFRNADNFDPSRDLPNLMTWRLQRAEVENGKVGTFRQIATLKTANEEILAAIKLGMQSTGEDYVDPRAMDPRLTLANPGIETHNLDKLARHSRVKSLEEVMKAEEEKAKREMEDAQNPASGGEYDNASGGEMFTPGFSPGRMEGGSSRVGGPPRDRMMGEGGPGRITPPRMEGGPGRSEGPGRMPYGGVGRQMPGSSGMPDQIMLDETFDPKKLVKYKMFRYYDFKVQRGKQYQYRLVLEYEDPNNPRVATMSPPDSALTREVLTRKNAVKMAQKADKKTVTFIRATEPSEPSNIVRVVAAERVLAGAVNAPKLNRSKTGVSFPKVGEEPTVKVMAVEYDPDRIAELAAEVVLHRGAIPYITKKIEPILRWKGWLEKPEDHRFRVDSVVLDIRGGDDLGLAKLTAPGEILVWDANARSMDVLTETKDAPYYATFVIPKADPTAENGGEGSSMAPGGRRPGEGGGGENRRRGGAR